MNNTLCQYCDKEIKEFADNSDNTCKQCILDIEKIKDWKDVKNIDEWLSESSLGRNDIQENIRQVQLYEFSVEHYFSKLSREKLFKEMMLVYKSNFKQSLVVFNDTLYRIDFEVYKKAYKQRYSKV